MGLQKGDWVRTETGEVGKVVHVNRLTVFVDFQEKGNASDIRGYLASKLTKIEPPTKPPK